jgi:hypothetical protein
MEANEKLVTNTYGGLIPGQTGRLTVSRKITLYFLERDAVNSGS